MVKVTTWLCRVPVIKFKKGGLGRPSGPSAAAPAAASGSGSCPIGGAKRAPATAQPAVAMSTLPDVDLPARFRRQPLSQEEIDHINGGGVDDLQSAPKKPEPKPEMLGMIKIPKGVLISGKRGSEVVSLNIVLQRQEPNRKNG